ncbi:MAG: DegT/DnrJ/EryC1/StrS family aminotransferase [Gammaproteobacteria bacterium]|nr:MAG: DegT/DnrJ/EryC1/StrS family aminotransferase [Gammaproteobacteria bacterium]
MTEIVPLARPSITAEDRQAVMQVLSSGRLSGGPRTLAFERRLASACGVAGAAAVSSGTAGLMLALEACKIGPGDEVITTPFTFVATTSAIRQLGATAVLADIDPDCWNIDPARIVEAITPGTRAVLPVHVFGRPADMTAIREIARDHDLRVIEDACEALGSRNGGQACGSMGDAAVFGFYPNKVVTSGEGGAVTSDDPAILEWCRRQRNHGRLPGSAAGGPVPGHNFRISELQAALAESQLKRLPKLVKRRQQLAGEYARRLSEHEDLRLPAAEPRGTTVAWFAYVVRLADRFDAQARDRIRKRMLDLGVETGHYFPAVHRLPSSEGPGIRVHDTTTHAEALADRVIALPFFHDLDDDQMDRVTEALLSSISQEKLR